MVDRVSAEEFRRNANDMNKLNSYADSYLLQEYHFNYLELEIEFLYSLASCFASCYINQVKDNHNIIDHIFQVDEDYYKSLYFYLRAVKLYEDNIENEWTNEKVVKLIMKRCYVNIANEYADHFRTMEALSFLRKSLKIDSNFDMAIGNFAQCIERHNPLFCIQSEGDNFDEIFNFIHYLYSKIDGRKLENPLDIVRNIEENDYSRSEEPLINAKNIFQKRCDKYNNIKSSMLQSETSKYSSEKMFTVDEYNEDNYQSWCCHNTLFFNLINDINYFKEAQFDMEINKQSFDSRIEESTIILLKNMMDLFCNQREKLFLNKNYHSSESKIELVLIFITLYSFFDKISYFLYKFFKLEGPEERININSIWSLKNKDGHSLLDYKNQYLYNIYWIRKEYRENNKAGIETRNDLLSPDAQEYALYRNVLEHRGFSFEDNTELFYLDSEKLYYKTLKLSKIVRNSILYLVRTVALEKNSIDEVTQKRNMVSLHLPFTLFHY